MRHALALLTFSLLLCACERAQETPPHEFEIIDDDGIPTAVTTGGPRFEGELFRYEQLIELRGEPSEAGSYLRTPSTPSVDQEGRYYVPDTRENRIVVFDRDGHYLRTIGQPGEGPGDLQWPTDVEAVGDTLMVTSTWSSRGRAQRVTMFNAAGSLIDVFVEEQSDRREPHVHYILTDGTRVSTQYDRHTEDERYMTIIRAWVFSTEGDTLSMVRTPDVHVGREVQANMGGRRFPYQVRFPFVALPQILIKRPDRIVTLNGNTGILKHHRIDGSIAKVVRIAVPKDPVTESDRSTLEAEYDKKIKEAKARSSEPAAAEFLAQYELPKAHLEYPEYKAYWTWAMRDEAGYFWLQLPEEHPFESGVSRNLSYRVVSPEGAYLGDTTWPTVFDGQVRVSRGLLLTIKEDRETGDLIPTVYRIIPAMKDLSFP